MLLLSTLLSGKKPKSVNGENRLPVFDGSIAWAEVSHEDSQKYDTSTW